MFRDRADAAFARFQRRGNPADLARVFDATAADLLRVARHLVGEPHAAEDVVQATFVAAIEHRARYDTARPVAAWLHGILANQAKRHHERARRAPDAARLDAAVGEAAASIAERRDLSRAVDDAIVRLPDAYQPVLRLHLTQGMNAPEIALALARAPDTVHKQISRGLERLRRLLPIGFASLLAGLALPSRGLAQVKLDVLAAARQMVPAGGAAVAVGVILGGWWMKQFLLRSGIVAAVLLLGWGGLELARAGGDAAPRASTAAEIAVAPLAASAEVPEPIAREVVAAAAPARDEIVFRGRCVASLGGAPLAGVPIVVLRMPLSFDLAESDYTDTHFLARAESADDGTFVCRCAWSEGIEFPVRVGGSEHVLRMRSFGPYLSPREMDLGDVVLRGGVRVISKVVDVNGQPVAGMKISAMKHGSSGRTDPLFEQLALSGRTDANGRLVWPRCLLPGRHRVTWDGFWTMPFERQGASMHVAEAPELQENVIVLPLDDATQSIRGIVVDTDGVPVPQLDVGALGAGTRGNARSNDDGAFVIARVGPFDAENRGPVGFGLPTAAQGFELVGETTCNWGDRDVRLVARPAATLIVRAVDAATGETVADVDVACAPHLDDGSLLPSWWGRPRTSEVRRPDGSVLRKVASCAHHVQVFPKDTRLAPSAKVVWHPRDGEQLVLPLSPLGTATVRVIAADGTPVAGTEVWALQPIEAVPGAPTSAGWQAVTPPGDTKNFAESGALRWARDGIDDAPLGSARTGADGRAQVPVPVAADVVFAALGPGHVPAAIVGRATGDAAADIELRVDRGASIRIEFSPAALAAKLGPSAAKGRLRSLGVNNFDDRGATVWVRRVTGDDQDQWPVIASVDLDGSDRCTCAGLAAGEYQLYLTNYMQSGSPDGVLVGRVLGRVSLREGEQGTLAADLSPLATGRLRGRVLVNGSPWAFGSGGASSRPGTRGLGDNASVEITTDARGEFDVEVPAGEYRLRLDYRNVAGNVGYWRPTERARVVAGATTDAVFTARFTTVRASIVHATGEPAPGVSVTLQCSAEPKGWQWWTTDTDGRITIDYVQQVPFEFVVRNPNGPARAGRRNTSSGDAVLGPFQIPQTGDTAEFRAVLPDGWR